MQLTQKEILYLKDALSHEHICVTNDNNYANELQDAELSAMFRNLANREQQHIDTINKLLQQGGAQ